MVRAGLGPEWSCLFANDIDPKKVASYVANWGEEPLLAGDVAELTTADLPGHCRSGVGVLPLPGSFLGGQWRWSRRQTVRNLLVVLAPFRLMSWSCLGRRQAVRNLLVVLAAGGGSCERRQSTSCCDFGKRIRHADLARRCRFRGAFRSARQCGISIWGFGDRRCAFSAAIPPAIVRNCDSGGPPGPTQSLAG